MDQSPNGRSERASKAMYWGPPDWSSAPEGDQNSAPSDGIFKIFTKLPTPEGCLTEDQNDQLGTYASPNVIIDSGAARRSDMGPGSPDPTRQAPDGPGGQVKSGIEG